MLWSLAKVMIFLCIVGLLAFFGAMLSDQGGTLRLWIFDYEFTLPPLAAVLALLVLLVALWAIMKLAGLLLAAFRFLNGDETAISRYFDRNREARGYRALSEGMIALAGGENTLALTRAKTATRLLNKPELTTLLTAQAAEAAGDRKGATEAFKALLNDEQTRFVAIRGLLRLKLEEGDHATALKLAERAFALKPRNSEVQDILLKLQSEGGDWRGARNTLSEKLRSGELPRSVYRRRDALLALQEAKTVLDEGSTVEAREAAIEANRLSPDLIPAAAIAARAMTEKGDKKGASRVLKKAWEAQPHPDLAAAFAQIEPEESPQERLKRFALLFKAQPAHEESLLTEAELYLAVDDPSSARKVLGRLPETHPTQRALALLAAAKRGEGAPEDEIRALLTRALTAPRGPQWCCEKCGTALEAWQPACPACNGFDTLVWREPDHAPQGPAQDLAPLFLAASTPKEKLVSAPENPAESTKEITLEILPPPSKEPLKPVETIEDAIEEGPQLSPDEILRRAT